MSFVCFILAAEYGVANLNMPACYLAAAENGRLSANENYLAPIPSEMRAKCLNRGLLRTCNDCAGEPVAAILDIALVDETIRTLSDRVGWFSTTSQMRQLFYFHGGRPNYWDEAFLLMLYPVLAHAKVASCYVEEFCDASLSRGYAEAVRARY